VRWQALKTLLQSRDAHYVRQEGSHQVWERKVGDTYFRTEIPVPNNGHDFSGVHLENILKSLGFDPHKAMFDFTGRQKAAPGLTKLAPEGSFGRRLYEARRALGMSQGDVARLAGTQQAQISEYERGAADPFKDRFGHGLSLNPNTKRVLLTLCEKFGFDDLLVTVKSAREQIVTRTKGRRIPTGVETTNIELVQPPLVEPNEPKHKQPTKDEKEFAKLVDADAIWIYVKELENEVEKLRLEIKKLNTEELVSIRHKAQMYDKIGAMIEKELSD
jgi:transcriptional regulator with XRE-family HTH domain